MVIHRCSMTTLHIEHAITDYETWKAAFDRFAEQRLHAGAVHHRILRPVDDPDYIVIHLDFGTADQARGFLAFLHGTVWSTPANAPALGGTPLTRILDVADEQ